MGKRVYEFWHEFIRRLGLGGSLPGRQLGDLAAVHLGGAALALVTQIVLARTLGVDEYGVYSVGIAWVAILTLVARCGMEPSVTRFTAEYLRLRARTALFGLAIRSAQITGVGGLVCGTFLVLGAAVLFDASEDAGLWAFGILGALVPLRALMGVTMGLLRGAEYPVLALAPERVGMPGATLLFAAGLLAFGMLEQAVDAAAAAFLAAAVCLGASVGWTLRRIRLADVEAQPSYRTVAWLRVSVPLGIVAIMQVVLHQTDTVMLGALHSVSGAGIYSVASRISELAALGVMAAGFAAGPVIARLNAEQRFSDLQNAATVLARIGTVSTGVAAIVLLVVGVPALSMFGAPFAAGYVPLVVLLVGQSVNAACGLGNLLLSMTGGQRWAAAAITVAAAVNVFLNWQLIPRFGPEGAALSTAASILVWNAILVVTVHRSLGLDPTIVGAFHRRSSRHD